MNNSLTANIADTVVNLELENKQDNINQPIQQINENVDTKIAQAENNPEIIDNVTVQETPQLSASLEKKLLTNKKIDVDIKLLTKRIYYENPIVAYQTQDITNKTNNKQVKFDFMIKQWTPIKSICLQIPRKIMQSTNTLNNFFNYSNSMSGQIQPMYAYLNSLITDMDIYVGNSKIELPKPSIRKNDSLWHRIMLAIMPKNKHEQEESSTLGLPYQTTHYPGNRYVQCGINIPNYSNLFPDWTMEDELCEMYEKSQDVYQRRLQYFQIPLYYLFPCLNSNKLLPPGFKLEIRYNVGYGYIYSSQPTIRIISGISPDETNAPPLNAYSTWIKNTQSVIEYRTSVNYDMNAEMARGVKISYLGITLNTETENIMKQQINRGINWSYFDVKIFPVKLYFSPKYYNEYLEFVIPLSGFMPKAIIFTPRAKESSTKNGLPIPNLFNSIEGGPLTNMNDNSCGYVYNNEIYPYMLYGLEISVGDNISNYLYYIKNDYLSASPTGSTTIPSYSYINNVSLLTRLRNKELNILFGDDTYYFRNNENNILQTKPYIAYLSPVIDFNELDIKEIIHRTNLNIRINYKTVNPMPETGSAPTNWPNEWFSNPLINDNLEIALLTKTNQIYLVGNEITYNKLPFN